MELIRLTVRRKLTIVRRNVSDNNLKLASVNDSGNDLTKA